MKAPDVVTPVSIEAGEFWHSVHDCLPEPLHDVLVVDPYLGDEPTIDMAYRKPGGRWVLTGSDPEQVIEPSHWMALPAAPDLELLPND